MKIWIEGIHTSLNIRYLL